MRGDRDRAKEALLIFGKNLSRIRKAKKISFRKLATYCNVDHSDIKKYEKGEKDLRFLTILELAKGLNIHPKELLSADFGYDSQEAIDF